MTADDVSDQAFGFGTCREIEADCIVVLASRIAYVGELGWELYVSAEQGARLWDTWGACPAVRAGTGRHWRPRDHRPDGEGLPLSRRRSHRRPHAGRSRHDPPEGQGAAFIGREAYLRHAPRRPSRRCARSPSTPTTRPTGRRATCSAASRPVPRRRAARRRPRADPYVTSAGSAPSLGKHLLMAYLLAAPRRTAASPSNTSASPIRSPSPRPAPPRSSTRPTIGSGASAMNVLVCVKRVPMSPARCCSPMTSRPSTHGTSGSP